MRKTRSRQVGIPINLGDVDLHFHTRVAPPPPCSHGEGGWWLYQWEREESDLAPDSIVLSKIQAIEFARRILKYYGMMPLTT